MSEQKEWLAVRCCCTPKKVFGFVPVETKSLKYVHLRMTPTVKLRDVRGEDHEVQVRKMTHGFMTCTDEFIRYAASESIDWLERTSTHELAVYSEDRPIEFWRTIDGFIEAKGEDDGKDSRGGEGGEAQNSGSRCAHHDQERAGD